MAYFKDLEGKILTSITRTDDEIIFTCATGEKYKMCHLQDCCEDVCIEDVNGDFEDLLNVEILIADEKVSEGEASDWGDTSTWTFYTIRTQKGSVDIRWFGSSNGYYSEGVDFIKLDEDGSFRSY